MRNIRTARHGFTLIEILIVVVILGILASIVIPHFTNASDQAAVSQARTQLQAMRSQCQLFRAQEGYLPGDADDLNGMDSVVACFDELVLEGFIPPYPVPAPGDEDRVGPGLGSKFTWSLSADNSRLELTASDSTDTSSW